MNIYIVHNHQDYIGWDTFLNFTVIAESEANAVETIRESKYWKYSDFDSEFKPDHIVLIGNALPGAITSVINDSFRAG